MFSLRFRRAELVIEQKLRNAAHRPLEASPGLCHAEVRVALPFPPLGSHQARLAIQPTDKVRDLGPSSPLLIGDGPAEGCPRT